MPAKWQRVAISIPKGYGPEEREAIAEEIVDFIRERVQKKNLDKNNKPLPGYSEAYVKSLAFKIAGKSKGDVNLTQSGDTLGALALLSHTSGKLLIGYENGTDENAIADGNIRGTYGKSKPAGPRRDFLGLAKEDLKQILSRFEIDDDTAAAKAGRGAGDTADVHGDEDDE